MNVNNSASDYIRYQQLNWYGQVRRVNGERSPRKVLEWYPPGKRRKGRSRNSWMQEATTEMGEKGTARNGLTGLTAFKVNSATD